MLNDCVKPESNLDLIHHTTKPTMECAKVKKHMYVISIGLHLVSGGNNVVHSYCTGICDR